MKILFWQITTCLCHVLHATPKFLTLSIDSDEGRILKLVGGKSSLARLTTQPWLKDLCDFPPVAAVYSILLFANICVISETTHKSGYENCVKANDNMLP